MKKDNYLNKIAESKKPFIIYKSNKGFDLFTDFSKKIILSNRNIENFINNSTKKKLKNKETDLYIGFFGYEILNNLIDVKIKKQKGLKFPKGIFYKPETKKKLSNKLNFLSVTNPLRAVLSFGSQLVFTLFSSPITSFTNSAEFLR